MAESIIIRKAEKRDQDDIWGIIKMVISSGDTYVFDPHSSREKMLDFWCGKDKHCYVATIDKKVVGTFIIKDNMPDLGSHVANAAYMTDPAEFGKGIGTAMGEFSIKEAKNLGYLSLQFNLVVKSNAAAIRLWKKLGFEIIAELPDAFRHKDLGLTNAYIMWRKL